MAYVAMVAGTVVAFLLIRLFGESTAGPTGPLSAGGGHGPANTLMHVLLSLSLVIITARLLGMVFTRLHQPAVIGEVIGGILLGPSLLGRIAPEAMQYLMPSSVAGILGIIAQLGVILYMFLVGLELNLKELAKSGHATLAISHASIIAPFLLGSLLALHLHADMAPAGVSFTVFALFLGVSMSVTAFPVLARILTDRGLHRTQMGTVALTCAAVDDVTAWCLLALVVSIAQADLGGALFTIASTLIFITVVLLLGQPLVRRILPRLEGNESLSRTSLAIIFVALLLSALATEFIGIHAIFGAFLLGAIIPPDSKISREMTHRLEDVVSVLFLPAFFAYTGMRTQIDVVDGAAAWLLCGGIILVACAGKFGGTLLAARFAGFSWRDAAGLGILMNTRGLVELIVLNLGLDLGVINRELFTMLVIMAIVTTVATSPVLHLLTRHHPWKLLDSVRAEAHRAGPITEAS